MIVEMLLYIKSASKYLCRMHIFTPTYSNGKFKSIRENENITFIKKVSMTLLKAIEGHVNQFFSTHSLNEIQETHPSCQ